MKKTSLGNNRLTFHANEGQTNFVKVYQDDETQTMIKNQLLSKINKLFGDQPLIDKVAVVEACLDNSIDYPSLRGCIDRLCVAFGKSMVNSALNSLLLDLNASPQTHKPR